jgi:hypothetical protein
VNGSERRLTLPAEDCTTFHGAGDKGWPGSFWRLPALRSAPCSTLRRNWRACPALLVTHWQALEAVVEPSRDQCSDWIAETLSLLPLVALVPLGVLLK